MIHKTLIATAIAIDEYLKPRKLNLVVPMTLGAYFNIETSGAMNYQKQSLRSLKATPDFILDTSLPIDLSFSITEI